MITQAIPKVLLSWTFRNDHRYTKFFDQYHEAVDFMLYSGLISHPDITVVQIDGVYFKGAKNGS